MSMQKSRSKRKMKNRAKPNFPQKAEAGLQNFQNQTWRPAEAPQNERDDLVQIAGIDPATEMALNSIGICRFADFQGQTPQSLSAALNTRAGVFIPEETIAGQDWVGRAQVLSEGAVGQIHQMDDHSMQVIPDLRSPTMQSREHPAQKPNDETDAARINDYDLSVEIIDAQFRQKGLSDAASQRNEQWLHGEIVCELAPTDTVTDISEPMTLCTQIHVIDLINGVADILASSSQKVLPGQAKFRTELDFKPPQIGRYQLHVVAMLLGIHANLALWRGPILRVEE